MRRVFFFGLLFLAGAVQAAEPQEVLRQLSKRIEALGDYHAAFEIRAEGDVRKGTYAVSGVRYSLHTDDIDIVSDGRTRWEINHADREVLVDRVDAASGNILTNPARAFEFAPEVFVSALRGQNIVVLTPRDKSSAVGSIEVVISAATGLPVELRYAQNGVLGVIAVRIESLVHGVPATAEFTFDPGKYPGYEVVDFR